MLSKYASHDRQIICFLHKIISFSDVINVVKKNPYRHKYKKVTKMFSIAAVIIVQ